LIIDVDVMFVMLTVGASW